MASIKGEALEKGHASNENDANESHPEGAEVSDDDEDEDVTQLQAETESVVEEVDEPDYTKANSQPFFLLCNRMEKLWKLRTKNNRKVKDVEKMQYLLPPNMIAFIEPESLYPILRLYLPDMDNSRNTYVKEKFIATMYTDALGLVKGQDAYDKLFNYTNPQNNKLAELSVAVEAILKERIPDEASSVTVGRINDLLDQLCQLRKKQTNSNHDWRQSEGGGSGVVVKKKKKNLNVLRSNWMRTVLSAGLSPLEHKWLVRVMLKKMEMGVGWRTILKWYHPYALELWNAHNSLKAVCNRICRGDFQERPQEQAETSLVPAERHNLLASYMPRSGEAVALNQMFGPMLSNRSSFESVLHDISNRHASFLKEWEGIEPLKDASKSLACNFPTFCMEVKLDGERMIVHIQNGIVKMHTRNSRWYSDWYSPALGPALRKAIARFDVDVILDGEVTAWDDVRKEYVPFGNSRTIAVNQERHMKRLGLLDDRDYGLHQNDDEGIFSRAGNSVRNGKATDEEQGDTLGCWLKYEAFDVLYVGGKDASALLAASVSEHRKPHVIPGSIVHLDGFERKKILYRLLDPQPNQVEIVPTLVVRSNGHTAKGCDYFSPDTPTRECGYPAYTLDSIDCTFNSAVRDLKTIDERRRGGYSDTQVNEARVEAVEHFYSDIVETRMLEGLIFKDLSAPYVLGETSRRLKYWHKIKPDYALKSWANDIDVVILGACYGTGLKNSGVLSHFLCGCVDSANEGTFMTFCKINGRSVSDDKLKAILEWTGYKKPEERGDEVVFGKWYREDDHGNSLPDFISHRSFQKGRGDLGWAFNRSEQYPDLWINPEDSVVLTIYGGEIIASDDFSVGLTLRFPRIDRVRLEDIDGSEKSPFEVASDAELWRRFQDADQKRSEAENPRDFHAGAPSATTISKGSSIHGFLTPDLYVQSTKAKRKKATQAGFVWSLPDVVVESCALRDITFTVLEGKYFLDKGGLDADEAKDQGWFDEASKVRSREDVMKFILRHGGLIKLAACSETTFVLGGRENDAKVVNHHRANKNAWAQPLQKNKKSKSTQAIESIRRAGAVLKWTFVFSLVQRWLGERRNERRATRAESGGYATDDEEDASLCIKTNKPEILVPKPGDYLIGSEVLDSDNLFGLSESKMVTMIDLKRSLDAINQQFNVKLRGPASKRAKPVNPFYVPWQYEALRSLSTCDRWVVGGTFQVFWPFTSALGDSFNEGKPVVLYPDVFLDSFGLLSEKKATEQVLSGEESAQWSGQDPLLLDAAMESSISLARTMGALVTPHLHDGVTHVLCSMLPGLDTIVWREDVTESDLDTVFCFPTRGKRLVERLRSLSASSIAREINLVSPNWVMAQWAD